jgi:hypothetical protein
VTLSEVALLLTIAVAVSALVRGMFAIAKDAARALYWVRHRGAPTEADFASAPNLRWYTASCTDGGDGRLDINVQCNNTGQAAQGVGGEVRSSFADDVIDFLSFNPYGVVSPGEFTFRMRSRATPSQGSRKIVWRLVYFDTHGRIGYLTECWAVLSAKPDRLFSMGPVSLDKSTPPERHKAFKRLPKQEQAEYTSEFKRADHLDTRS